MLVSKPPKGGTLTAAGVPSPRAWANPPPLEFRVYAEPSPNPKPFRVFSVFRGQIPSAYSVYFAVKSLSRISRVSWLTPLKQSVRPLEIRSVV
ncbi:MAG: hypothetical protein GX456_18080 [Verrucomicrobia bacterium]|nr:hypothetical protein [Verrucomicrobiota bacterium]